jgi:hypothetical protein
VSRLAPCGLTALRKLPFGAIKKYSRSALREAIVNPDRTVCRLGYESTDCSFGQDSPHRFTASYSIAALASREALNRWACSLSEKLRAAFGGGESVTAHFKMRPSARLPVCSSARNCVDEKLSLHNAFTACAFSRNCCGLSVWCDHSLVLMVQSLFSSCHSRAERGAPAQATITIGDIRVAFEVQCRTKFKI